MPYFPASLTSVETEIETYSRSLSAEAECYWQRHAVRYAYMAHVLRDRCAPPPRAILDIGMGFETLVLRRLFPEAAVDCMGVYEDERFRPSGETTFIQYDLNDVVIATAPKPILPRRYDLIVFMEVLEHLITPAEDVFAYLLSLLAPGGRLFVTTPNGAWLKNRLKLLRGVNPFEQLKADRSNMGHVREYTQGEMVRALEKAGGKIVFTERRGLYTFNNRKDNVYSFIADHTHSSLSRTLIALAEARS